MAPDGSTWVNQTLIAEANPSLLTFYYRKGNPVGDDDTMILGLDEASDITGVDEETDEIDEYDIKNDDSQYEYDITYVDIDQYGHQYDQ